MRPGKLGSQQNKDSKSKKTKKGASTAAVKEDEDEDEEEFIVEKLLGTRAAGVDGNPSGARQFLVKWHGYDAESDLTWEPAESLNDALHEYVGYAENVA